MSTDKNIAALLAQADKKNGFPAGTMASVMKQETGGNAKFLDDPTAYHYAANADGKRIAGHTGKVSTAFGPFGIVESTAKDPGFGVTPLQNKDFGEQVRFASEYLAARSKGAGSLVGGLAGYGEGTKYAQQVAARTGGAVPADAPIPASVPVAVQSEPVVAAAPVLPPAETVVAQLGGSENDAWQTFLRNMPRQAKQPVTPEDLRYGVAEPTPQFQFAAPAPQSARPNFAAFGQWGRRA